MGRRTTTAAALAALLWWGWAATLEAAPFAYVPNRTTANVSVIDLATNSVHGNPIPVGRGPTGVAVSPDGGRVYVTNQFDGTLSIIDAATHTTLGPAVRVGDQPFGVGVHPTGRFVYVANNASASVSVVDTVSPAPAQHPAAGRPSPDRPGSPSWRRDRLRDQQ